MVAKIFLGVAIVSTLAFLVVSLRVGRQIEESLHTVGKDSAVQMATMVRSSIEQAMLSGNGIKVKRLVEELKTSVTDLDTEIRIYDPQGIEVFAQKPPPPQPGALNAQVAEVLEKRLRVTEGDRVFRSIPMEERCSREGCHDAADPLRGVLSIEVAQEKCRDNRSEVISTIIMSGFLHLMTARQSNHLDEYFSDISKASPNILSVAVYDNEGDTSFGEGMEGLGVTQETIIKAMAQSKPMQLQTESGTIEILTLMKQARCIECHTQDEELRGALIVALAPSATPEDCDVSELETLVDTSLRHIMTSELGRIIARFLDSIVETGGVKQLVLYDKLGRTYWDTTHPPALPHIANAISSQSRSIEILGSGQDQRVRVVEPLFNSPRCARCHGDDMALRGLVEVSLSTRIADDAKNASKTIVIVTTVLAVIGLLIILIAILQMLVLRPVRQISSVTESIGEGQLDVKVTHANEKGDEIARLGHRINTMAHDLRTKVLLEKFVSRRTAAAARTGGLSVTSQGGQRITATILFSDIRGFTAYSEANSAEEVVAMLNRLLKAQTDIVHQYSGDIDKFIGDELMAIFQGENANARATACAVAMLKAVHQVRETDLEVGIGISTGEVLMGAIGHEDRLDFTAIGDVVNTGARLCSAAPGGEILVTEEVANQAMAHPGCPCTFEVQTPIRVKGKSEALKISRIVR